MNSIDLEKFILEHKEEFKKMSPFEIAEYLKSSGITRKDALKMIKIVKKLQKEGKLS